MIVRAAAAALLLWIAGFMAFALFLPQPAPDGVVTDGIVVMTGGRGRVERGLRLLEAKQAKRLLISGADRRVRPHELAVQFKAPMALVECCVDLGHESVDTRSNAAEAAGWIARRRYTSIRLVTSDWHMVRARFDLRNATGDGLEIVTDAVPTEPGLIDLVREYNKYLLRRIAALIGI
ncbi:YdcF family protein [Sphingomonas histidinilytica]|uniref:YdcF family protein n=1 Tax=Rhizorhabdus histidinilytica TaxID=439228 RepID=UPI000F791ADC|nr:YdcF family protein [Rhizorhabdus histidinilytica]MBO9379318.1 YdcF family protein [Rhizorhabdus histidinilytica]QEH80619.1 YdcF family protein [Sphingomonas sp. C8-2]